MSLSVIFQTLFWAEVEDFKNASGENPFLDFFNCAKQALILPHSNADVERVQKTN